MIRLHAAPFFGDKKVSDVTIETISAFRTFLVKDKTKGVGKVHSRLSRKYQTEIWNYTKAAFFFVDELDPSLEWKNPFTSRITKKSFSFDFDNRTVPFTKDEIDALFAGHWLNPLVESMALFCTYTGCRVNEVTALKKADFKIRDNWVEVSINKSWSPALRDFKSPKTKAGRRTVIFPRYVFNYIRPYITWTDSSLVFSSDGQHVMQCKTYSRALHKQLEKLSIDREGLVFYSFRPFFKSYTSDYLSGELSAYLMGHSERTMGDHYFHFDAKVHAPRILSAVIGLPASPIR